MMKGVSLKKKRDEDSSVISFYVTYRTVTVNGYWYYMNQVSILLSEVQS